eukprot:SAG11_NODE_642_length_8006_cov_6.996965_9_plen_87_part_00
MGQHTGGEEAILWVELKVKVEEDGLCDVGHKSAAVDARREDSLVTGPETAVGGEKIVEPAAWDGMPLSQNSTTRNRTGVFLVQREN